MRTAQGFQEIGDILLMEEGLQLPLDKHGDRATGLFIGEPYAWEEPKSISDVRLRLRIGMNFYSTGENRMRIVVLGSRDFRELVRLRDKFDLNKWIWHLTRDRDEGTEGSQLYFQLERELEKERRLTDAQWRVQCYDLPGFFGRHQAQQNDASKPNLEIRDERT